MNTKTAQIEQGLAKLINIRKKVEVGEKFINAAGNPVLTYFRVSKIGGVAKHADKNLQKILEISLGALEFSNSFYEKGKWRDSGWLIENLTEGSVGRQKDNEKGIITLRKLQNQVKEIKCELRADS